MIKMKKILFSFPNRTIRNKQKIYNKNYNINFNSELLMKNHIFYGFSKFNYF